MQRAQQRFRGSKEYIVGCVKPASGSPTPVTKNEHSFMDAVFFRIAAEMKLGLLAKKSLFKLFQRST